MGSMTYFYTTSDISCQMKKRRFVRVLHKYVLEGKVLDMHDLHDIIITVATSAYVCFILVPVLTFSTMYNKTF
jgi:hypothetical protein